MSGASPIDTDRLWDDLMALAAITDPDRPWTRRSFTPLFLEGRAWLEHRFREAGLEVRLDAGGNLIGRMEGSDPAAGTILIGSHSDTVPSGGRFDGVAGVIAALEVARALREAGTPLRHAVEVVDFLAEEPSEYGISCVGSRAMAGALDAAMLEAREPGSETLRDAMTRIGAVPEQLGRPLRDDVAAYFELHIEQATVLESSATEIGVVSAIVGIARVDLELEGRADHAGTMPMHLRADAGLAAARFISWVGLRAEALAAAGRGHFVATAGVVEVSPGAANIVPGRARLVLDIRAEDHDLTEEFLAEAEAECQRIAGQTRVTTTRWSVLSDSDPVECDPVLRGLLADAAEANGFSHLTLASGAGHDAAFVTRLGPSAMVFIPCLDGRSHAPEEYADPAAIAAGATVIHDAVLRLDAAGHNA